MAQPQWRPVDATLTPNAGVGWNTIGSSIGNFGSFLMKYGEDAKQKQQNELDQQVLADANALTSASDVDSFLQSNKDRLAQTSVAVQNQVAHRSQTLSQEDRLASQEARTQSEFVTRVQDAATKKQDQATAGEYLSKYNTAEDAITSLQANVRAGKVSADVAARIQPELTSAYANRTQANAGAFTLANAIQNKEDQTQALKTADYVYKNHPTYQDAYAAVQQMNLPPQVKNQAVETLKAKFGQETAVVGSAADPEGKGLVDTSLKIGTSAQSTVGSGKSGFDAVVFNNKVPTDPTQSTIGQLESYSPELRSKAKNSSAMGAFQQTNESRLMYGKKLFGEDFKDVVYGPAAQVAMAREQLDDVLPRLAQSGKSLTDVWVGLKKFNKPDSFWQTADKNTILGMIVASESSADPKTIAPYLEKSQEELKQLALNNQSLTTEGTSTDKIAKASSVGELSNVPDVDLLAYVDRTKADINTLNENMILDRANLAKGTGRASEYIKKMADQSDPVSVANQGATDIFGKNATPDNISVVREAIRDIMKIGSDNGQVLSPAAALEIYKDSIGTGKQSEFEKAVFKQLGGILPSIGNIGISQNLGSYDVNKATQLVKGISGARQAIGVNNAQSALVDTAKASQTAANNLKTAIAQRNQIAKSVRIHPERADMLVQADNAVTSARNTLTKVLVDYSKINRQFQQVVNKSRADYKEPEKPEELPPPKSVKVAPKETPPRKKMTIDEYLTSVGK